MSSPVSTGIGDDLCRVYQYLSRPLSPAIPPWAGAVSTWDGFGHLREETAPLKLRPYGAIEISLEINLNTNVYNLQIATVYRNLYRCTVMCDGWCTCAEKISKTVQIEASTVDIEERGVKLRLTVVDTPGYGDAINCHEWYVAAVMFALWMSTHVDVVSKLVLKVKCKGPSLCSATSCSCSSALHHIQSRHATYGLYAKPTTHGTLTLRPNSHTHSGPAD